jgi:oxygen-independent coproporphyrinogen-3 oxidase
MLGMPGQSDAGVLDGIDRMIRAGVSHVSIYLLELHGRTRLGRSIRLGRVTPMEDDAAAALFEGTADALARAGFDHYEVSNFARPGHRSRHNLKYWTDQEYLGFGPAAHSYLGGRRFHNPHDLATYLRQGGEGIERIEDPQPRAVRGFEALCAGLRVCDGVDLDDLRGRYGPTVPSPEDPRLGELLEAGLVSIEGTRLRIAKKGRLVSNEILTRLLGRDLPGEGAKAPPGVS